MRKHGRVDNTQKPIVGMLRQMGATVEITSSIGGGFPDLVVGWRGRTFLVETKTGNGKLTKDQSNWHAKWAGHVAIARTPEEAVLAISRPHA